jgi:hypothetical protein
LRIRMAPSFETGANPAVPATQSPKPALSHKTQKNSLTPANRAFRRLRVAVGRVWPLRSPALRPDPHAGAVFEVSVPVPERGTAGNCANRKH